MRMTRPFGSATVDGGVHCSGGRSINTLVSKGTAMVLKASRGWSQLPCATGRVPSVYRVPCVLCTIVDQLCFISAPWRPLTDNDLMMTDDDLMCESCRSELSDLGPLQVLHSSWLCCRVANTAKNDKLFKANAAAGLLVQCTTSLQHVCVMDPSHL